MDRKGIAMNIWSKKLLENIGNTPLQNTLPFLGVGGLERQGAPVIKIKITLMTNQGTKKQRKAPLLL